MRSINNDVGFFMDDHEFVDDEEYPDEDAKYQQRHCIFCNKVLGKHEYIKFNFPYKQKYEVAHYDCFKDKCQDLGVYEDGIAEILDCLGIEIEF